MGHRRRSLVGVIIAHPPRGPWVAAPRPPRCPAVARPADQGAAATTPLNLRTDCGSVIFFNYFHPYVILLYLLG